jgi:hypothetical protein
MEFRLDLLLQLLCRKLYNLEIIFEICSYFAHEMSLVSHTAHLTYILADVHIVAMLITAQSRKIFEFRLPPRIG